MTKNESDEMAMALSDDDDYITALEAEIKELKRLIQNITYTHHDGYADKDADECPACSMVPPGYQGGISR